MVEIEITIVIFQIFTKILHVSTKMFKILTEMFEIHGFRLKSLRCRSKSHNFLSKSKSLKHFGRNLELFVEILNTSKSLKFLVEILRGRSLTISTYWGFRWDFYENVREFLILMDILEILTNILMIQPKSMNLNNFGQYLEHYG